MSEPPLITFFVTSYNQEQFVREAVAGAFAQTYSPLEIILSDDASTDRSFAIMQEMAAAYRGPHRIILNRCERNVGTGRHLNAVAQLAHGVLHVGNAGDDISKPERTARVFEAWDRAGRTAMSVFSNAEEIDVQGRPVRPRYLVPIPPQLGDTVAMCNAFNGWPLHLQPLTNPAGCLLNWVLGAAHAFHARTYEVFGPLHDGLIQEDLVIPLRSLLLGGILFIDEPLVLYRRHPDNFWPDGVPYDLRNPKFVRMARGKRVLEQNRLADLCKATELGLLDPGLFAQFERRLKFSLQCHDVEIMLAEARFLASAATGLRHLTTGLDRGAMAAWLARRYATEIRTNLRRAARAVRRAWRGPRAAPAPNRA